MKSHWSKVDLSLSQTERGIVITQRGDGYMAKNWILTERLSAIIEFAVQCGLGALYQNGHPQASKRIPVGDGAEYISFARTESEYWVFCVNDNSATNKKYRDNITKVLFNKRYRHALANADIPHEMESFRNASNVEVPIEHMEEAVRACLPYLDIHAVRGGKRGAKGSYNGFRDEADIERWLMESLHNTELGVLTKIIGRQVRIDVGILDILLEHKQSKSPVVLEVKQGRAQAINIDEQLTRYLQSSYIHSKAEAKPGSAYGILVAEKIEANVISAIENSPHQILGYEISWLANDNVTLMLVAGHW